MVIKMLINACHPEECRVAVVADGLLEELDVQVNTREATLGNIYKGQITRVEPSLQAAFVDYGGPRNGFLSINDVHPSYFPESFEAARRRPRLQDVFKKDDHVIVQVAKEERSNKGASLTTNISLAGRYLVLMPGTDLCGVSRKIEDDIERKKLKEILQQLKPPENIGFIIRTAGMGRTKTELSRDLEYLLKLWQCIEKNVADQPAPALLHREHDLVIRAIREHFASDISEILVDDKEVHKKVREFFHQVMPKYEPLVKLYQEKRPLFNKYQLEEQIEHVYSKRIKLKSGGSIVIEPTEALVTIDVNSGGAIKEKGIEETAYKVNMEAAPEIARQLRLRDLGGIIVIDFIDMSHKMHKQEVEKAIKTALKLDRAKNKVLRISALGLLELSRQRLKSSLGTGEYLDCPICDGAGKVRSAETSALSIFRRMKSLLIKSDVTEVKATVPPKVAEYLLNTMRAHLVELESQYSSKITIQVGHGVADKDVTVEAVREEPMEAPLELAAPPQAPAPQPAMVMEVAVDTEEEAVAVEEEKKKTKKPARRRRRTKKRVTSEVETEGLAAENGQPAAVEEAAEDREVEGLAVTPDRTEERETQPLAAAVETTRGHGWEPPWEDQEQVPAAQVELAAEPVEQPRESVERPAEKPHQEAVRRTAQKAAHKPMGDLPEHTEKPGREAADDSAPKHEDVDPEALLASPLDVVDESASAPSPEKSEAAEQSADVTAETAPVTDVTQDNGKEKRPVRKSSLQNYLPFL